MTNMDDNIKSGELVNQLEEAIDLLESERDLTAIEHLATKLHQVSDRLGLQLQEPEHCDTLTYDGRLPDFLRWWIVCQRLPASLKQLGPPLPPVYANLKGVGRVRLTMASRFGDIGVTPDLTKEYGYSQRVPLKQLSGFSLTPKNN